MTAERFAPVPKMRRYRRLLIIDIAVPRDFDSAIGRHDNVFLYNVDDLQSQVEVNLEHRQSQLDFCRRLVDRRVYDYLAKAREGDVGAVIAQLRQRLDELGHRELEYLLPKLDGLSEHDRRIIEKTFHRLTRKILHKPTQALHDRGDVDDAQLYVDLLRRLFDLPSRD